MRKADSRVTRKADSRVGWDPPLMKSQPCDTSQRRIPPSVKPKGQVHNRGKRRNPHDKAVRVRTHLTD